MTQVNIVAEDNKNEFENHPILQWYNDVFPDEILGFPSKRNINFSIELIPSSVLVSKTPYRMNIVELMELKL